MTDSNTHIQNGIDRGRLSAAKLEQILHWMQLAQGVSPPPRLSAEQLSALLAQIGNADDLAEQTPT